MGFKINNAFLLKSTPKSIVSRTNDINSNLKEIIEETLIEENLNMIFELFVLKNYYKDEFKSLSSLLSNLSEEDMIFNFILKLIDLDKYSFKDAVLKLISSFALIDLKSSFNLDAFIYHKTLNSNTYYIVDAQKNSIIEKICLKIQNNEIINIKPYNCNHSNDMINEKEWLEVLNKEDIYTGMSRIQVSKENYYYKIHQEIFKNVENKFFNEEKIKQIIYKREKYLELLSLGKNRIESKIQSEDYIKNCTYENKNINSKIITRYSFIKLFQE